MCEDFILAKNLKMRIQRIFYYFHEVELWNHSYVPVVASTLLYKTTYTLFG